MCKSLQTNKVGLNLNLKLEMSLFCKLSKLEH